MEGEGLGRFRWCGVGEGNAGGGTVGIWGNSSPHSAQVEGQWTRYNQLIYISSQAMDALSHSTSQSTASLHDHDALPEEPICPRTPVRRPCSIPDATLEGLQRGGLAMSLADEL